MPDENATLGLPPHIAWVGDAKTGFLRLLDQTQLPERETFLDCRDVQSVWDAIKRLSVRGAPAIGVAAGYGCVIAVQSDDQQTFERGASHLATSRPTAVNLFWAIDRMRRAASASPWSADTPARLLDEARRIHDEDAAMCRAIGEHGAAVLRKLGLLTDRTPAKSVLTHCNAGALATGGIGTATAPIYTAHRLGHCLHVFADETRPLLQGARLTAYELRRAGVEVTLLCDNMAGQVLREGRVGAIIVGADRIAANGDAANKIGTYSLAVLAKHHRVPFFVAAPSSTFDMTLADGSRIPIEQRAEHEVTQGFGKRTAPVGVGVYNPAFDVTPHELIAGIITERGVIEPVNADRVKAMIG